MEVVSDELGFDQQLSFDGIRPARVGDVLYLRYVGVEVCVSELCLSVGSVDQVT